MIIRSLLLCFIALSLPLVAHSEDFPYIKQLKTRYGLAVLKLDPNESGIPNTDLIINGKKITKTANVIVKKFEMGTQDILLLQDSSGGASCPATFSLVIIEKKLVTVSEDFGNCADEPDASLIKDTLLIKFGRVNRFVPSETVQFDNGKLYGMVFSKTKGGETKKVHGELKMEKFSF